MVIVQVQLPFDSGLPNTGATACAIASETNKLQGYALVENSIKYPAYRRHQLSRPMRIEGPLRSFRVSELPSFQISELPSFQVTKFPSFQVSKGGREGGPMRGLELIM